MTHRARYGVCAVEKCPGVGTSHLMHTRVPEDCDHTDELVLLPVIDMSLCFYCPQCLATSRSMGYDPGAPWDDVVRQARQHAYQEISYRSGQ